MRLVVSENDGGDPNSWNIHGQSIRNYSFTRQSGEIVVQKYLLFHYASLNGLLPIQRLSTNIRNKPRILILNSA